MQSSTRDLAIISVSRNFSAGFHFRIQTGRRLVIGKQIHRIFDGVKTGFAGLNWTIVIVGLPDFILVASALHIQIEAFESDDGGSRRFFCGGLRNVFLAAIRMIGQLVLHSP